MKVFHTALLREVSNSVPFTSKDPFGGQKPLQTHWTSGMNPCCADTNLSSEAKAVAVSKARAGVPEDAGAVHLLQKLFSCLLIFCNNDISVGAAIFMDVIHSVLHAVHHLNAALQVPVLCPQRLHLRWAES